MIWTVKCCFYSFALHFFYRAASVTLTCNQIGYLFCAPCMYRRSVSVGTSELTFRSIKIGNWFVIVLLTFFAFGMVCCPDGALLSCCPVIIIITVTFWLFNLECESSPSSFTLSDLVPVSTSVDLRALECPSSCDLLHSLVSGSWFKDLSFAATLVHSRNLSRPACILFSLLWFQWSLSSSKHRDLNVISCKSIFK